MSKNRNDLTVIYEYTNLLLETEQYHECKKQLEFILNKDPKHFEAMFRYGNVLIALQGCLFVTLLFCCLLFGA